MKKKKVGLRVVGRAAAKKGPSTDGESGCVGEGVRIREGVPGLRGGEGVSLFDVCDLLEGDLGLTVTMQEVIEHLERSGVEGVKVPTEYAGILKQFNFGGWNETWKSSVEPFMDLSGIGVLERVPKYAGLKTHPAWIELKKKTAQEKWRVIE